MANIFNPSSIPLSIPYSLWKNFNFIKPLRIRGSDTNLTDYQIKLTLNSTNFPFEKCRSDGNDIRFIDVDGNSINYWLESWSETNKNGKIWLRIPEISASTDKIIWLVYGNPTSLSNSNGDDVFELFDDFTGTVIDTAKWSETDPGGTISQDDTLIFSGSGAAFGTFLYSISNTARPFIFEWKWKASQNNTNGMGIGIKDTGAGGSYSDFVYWIQMSQSPDGNLDFYHDGTASDVDTGTYSANTQYWWRFVVYSTGTKLYQSIDNETWTLIKDDSAYSNETPLKVGLTCDTGTFEMDDFKIRKYTSSEPSIIVI